MFERYTTPSKLRHKGIMGMNKRNHSYIGRYNDRSKYPLVDDKLKNQDHRSSCRGNSPCPYRRDPQPSRSKNHPQHGERLAGFCD